MGISVFRQAASYTARDSAESMVGSGREGMKLAAELVRKGATVMAEPCQRCGGIQVRYRGKVYCTGHEDLSPVLKVEGVSLETVVAETRELIVSKLNETAKLLEKEKDPVNQDRLVSLLMKYFELLQKLPHK